jgi:hypothetical protein
MNDNIDKDVQAVLLRIFTFAETSKLSEFHFLRTWYEYREYYLKYKNLKKLIKILKRNSKRILRAYWRAISIGEQDNKLCTYMYLSKIISFYEQEFAVVSDMVDEYEAYLFSGYLLSSYMGFTRSEDQLEDFRKRVFTLWNP